MGEPYVTRSEFDELKDALRGWFETLAPEVDDFEQTRLAWGELMKVLGEDN